MGANSHIIKKSKEIYFSEKRPFSATQNKGKTTAQPEILM